MTAPNLTTRASNLYPVAAVFFARLWNCQAQVFAQRCSLVVGAEHTALLQQRHDAVDEWVEPARGDVGDQDEAVAGIGLHEMVDGFGDRGRRADEILPPGDLDDEFAGGEVLRLGLGAPLVGDGDRIAMHPHTGPALGDRVLADQRVDGGQRPVGVVIGKVAVPQLFEEFDRGGRARPGPVAPRGPARRPPRRYLRARRSAAGRISN